MSASLAAPIREPLDEFLFSFSSLPSPWTIVLGGLVLIVFVVVRARYRRGGASRGAPAPLDSDQPPHAAALGVLDELEGNWPSGERELDAFHVLLSFVVRRYVHHRFGVRALERATDELLDSFHGRHLPPAQLDSLRTLLERCDQVKFAAAFRRDAARDARESARTLLARARDFVNETAVEEGGVA